MMNSSADKTPLFKFIIIGESGVGKSCLLLRYTKDEFTSEYNVTIGVEFSSKTVEIDLNTKIKLQIWDTAGQESFRSIVRSFYRNVTAVFLVYNITKRDTLEKLDGWLKEAKENASPNIVTVLVGAQNDLEEQRQVSYDEGKSFIDEKGINLFFETSAKNNQNVDLVLSEFYYMHSPKQPNQFSQTISMKLYVKTITKSLLHYPNPKILNSNSCNHKRKRKRMTQGVVEKLLNQQYILIYIFKFTLHAYQFPQLNLFQACRKQFQQNSNLP
ncbi:unnamed protein product [Paramecium sonneborni]|uniref:Uncharacterized protein n=1 Tax=Paramecium sonneborni TaxID=65129 RepID=A0A8S1MYH3_9CILI|nr:unnamed protein product [Paramecium sonneborni]